jgi:hypothetical protein
MREEHFPDPFEEAAQITARDAAKIATIIVGVSRAVSIAAARAKREREARDERARAALEAQEKAERAALRASWAPANDPDWLAAADLTNAAVAWCAAVPYADADETALSAVTSTENRLRELHAHAMAHYDRLRVGDTGRLEAMRLAAPYFLRRPDVREHDGAFDLALDPGIGQLWADTAHGPSRDEFEVYQRGIQILRRGTQILHRLQAAPSEDDQRAVLANATNIPPAAIPPALAAARKPWQQDFPFPITDVLAVAAADTRQVPVPARFQQQISERRVPS